MDTYFGSEFGYGCASPHETEPYEVSRLRLGCGGNGSVWLGRSAEDPLQLVAVKRRFTSFGDGTEATEHAILALMQPHPNVVSLLSCSLHDRYLYMVLELLSTDLHQEIRSGNVLSEASLRDVAYQLLSAVRHVHEHGVAHRDIKPSNVFLAMGDNPSGVRLVLGDFGVAHRAADIVGQGMNLRGTPPYQAPELLRGDARCEAVAFASDMWAVGCTLFEAVSGVPAFSGDSSMALLGGMCDRLGTDMIRFPVVCREPTLWHSLSGSSPACVSLLRWLLALDPRQRPSAEEALRHPFFHASTPGSPIQLRSARRFDVRDLGFTPLSHCHLNHSSINVSAWKGRGERSVLRTLGPNSTFGNMRYSWSPARVLDSVSPTPARKLLTFDSPGHDRPVE